MADLAFDLEYDGPALAGHEMDVRDLAPALISTADYFQELARFLHPVDPPVSVNVRATEDGSFLVQLKLLYDQSISTLAGDESTAAANLATLVTITGQVVRAIVHRWRSPEVAEVEVPDEPGVLDITYADGQTVRITRDALAASRNVRIQRTLSEVIAPVDRDGIDVVRIVRDEVVVAEVPKQDIGAFDVSSLPPQRDIIFAGNRETYLTIHTVGFQTNRWRFSDGLSLFWAAITDEGFIGEVDSGTMRVGKLDVVHCEIHEEKWRDSAGLHSDVEVLDVIEVIPYDPGAQGSLDLS